MQGLICPEKPERLLGQPIGMYHCPYCGTMVMAGCEHPKFAQYRLAEDITEDDEMFLGLEKKTGWFAMGIDFSHLGVYSSEEEAEDAWREHAIRFLGKLPKWAEKQSEEKSNEY